jgi:hypothetical protein
MSSNTGPPEKKYASPSGLAQWMVKASLPDHLHDEALAAFKDEFLEIAATRGKMRAHIWALRTSWETFYVSYEAIFQLTVILLAIVGVILAIVAV